MPGEFYQPVIAATFGTATHAMFPVPPKRDPDEVLAVSGMDTLELAAQEAKAWSRIGDRRQAEVALDRGRRLLDALPYPDNLDHHFVVDPTKFDFYAMDCYRMLAEDKLAESLAGAYLEQLQLVSHAADLARHRPIARCQDT
jgi:hypothetical protein